MSRSSGQKHVLVGTFKVRVIKGSIAGQQVDIIIRPHHPHVELHHNQYHHNHHRHHHHYRHHYQFVLM